ncbi:MAG: ribosome maturation factor RimP [Acidimicrobiaceae bacterium]|nr:ribosome maturation factor RimP [Acidimicrobiaceae bacterium]
MSDASNLKRVHSLVAPIIADLKLDLYDLEFRGGTLRVTIDTPAGSTGGVDLEAIALATRLIGREFDHHDPVPGHYTLEVTSPGLERTLRTPAHYQREIGKTIAVRLRDTVNVGRRVQGVLVSADDRSATIRLDTRGRWHRAHRRRRPDRRAPLFRGPRPSPACRLGQASQEGAVKAPPKAGQRARQRAEAPATSRQRAKSQGPTRPSSRGPKRPPLRRRRPGEQSRHVRSRQNAGQREEHLRRHPAARARRCPGHGVQASPRRGGRGRRGSEPRHVRVHVPRVRSR